MKKVVVVTSTPRKGGNSELLAQHFADGALEAGNEVQFIIVRELNLKFCTGCLYCQSHDSCIINDGLNGIYNKFQNADVVVFATPIYYYSISGQLKTFLDRLNPLYSRKNKFKDVYLLATAADEDEKAIDKAKTAVQGWIDCFDKVKLKDSICAVGVTNKGEILNTEYLKQAFEMGKNV